MTCSVLQVGSDRAPNVLLDMTNDDGQGGARHKVDIHPSQLFGALLPTEEPVPFTALETFSMDNGSGSSSAYLNISMLPRQRSPLPLQRSPPSKPPLPPRSPPRCATKVAIPQPGLCAGQRAWWPAWQGGKPVQQAAALQPPPLPPPPDDAEEANMEELLQMVNSGSDDSCSESDAGGSVAMKVVASEKASPKIRTYDPALAGFAAASPRPPGIAEAVAGAEVDADESDDVSNEQLLADMLGGDSLQGGKQNTKVLVTGGPSDGLQGSSVSSSSSGSVSAPKSGHQLSAVGAALQQIPLQSDAPAAEFAVGAASINDLVVGGIAGDVASKAGGNGVGLPGSKRRVQSAPFAAKSMYALSSSGGVSSHKRGRNRSRSRDGSTFKGSREPSVAKSEATETSSLSSTGVFDNA